MIVFIYGTTGELIKVAPVMRELTRRGIDFEQWTTGQQATQIEPLARHMGLPPVDVWIGSSPTSPDLQRMLDLPRWALGILSRIVRQRRALRRRLRADGHQPFVIVHGDTMTTLYGALIGRFLGARVGHVEAGLRSFDLLHPFPEELSRRLTSRVATRHYAPGSWAAGNLGPRDGVVDTITNTLRDSIDMAVIDHGSASEKPEHPYAVASIHRQELLGNADLLRRTMELLFEAATQQRILFIEHAITVHALRAQGLYDRYVASDLVQTPRLPYFEFTDLLRDTTMLFTDSGGGQEETYYLDVPCLIHRKRTERREGLGENVVLSEYDLDAARRFFADPARYRRTTELPTVRPSEIIADDLIANGYTGGAATSSASDIAPGA